MSTAPKMLIMLIVFMLAASIPNAGLAASAELNIPIHSALEKLIAKADSPTKSKLHTFYSDLLTLQQQEEALEEKWKVIHYNNEADVLELKEQIKRIDEDKLEQLKDDLEKTKNRYRPILNVANPASILLGSKGRTIRFGVQLARQDIQAKQAKLQAAKDNTARTIRLLRATLATINPKKVQIKEAKNAVILHKTRVSSASKSFNSAVKKGNTKLALEWLTTLSALSRQIVVLKQNMNTVEHDIADIIQTVKAQIPAL